MYKTFHIPFLIICSRHWSLYDLMDIAGFTFLGILLNLTGPTYLEHVSSVFLISLIFWWWNWTLLIGPFQLLKFSLYWFPKKIQSFSSVDQAKESILASGSVTNQGIIDPLSSLYNPPNCGPSTITLGYFIASNHFITTMVNIAPSGAWLIILAPSGSESSIRIDYSFFYSEKKPWTDWLPLGDNHSSNYWSSYPWS